MGKKGVLKAKDVEVVDKRTGEVIEGTWYILAPKNVDVGFCKFFVPLLEELFQDDTIAKNAIRLFFWIVSHLDYNTLEFVLVPEVVCRDLKVGRTTFFRWKRILLEKGLIAKKATHIYMIRPYAAIKGHMAKISDEELKLFYRNMCEYKTQEAEKTKEDSVTQTT